MSAVASDAEQAPRPPGGHRDPGTVSGVLITLVACLFGLGVLVYDYHGLIRVFPAEAAFALLLLVLTVVVGYAIARRVRPVWTPPHRTSLFCLLWGMTAAVGCAILANGGLGDIWAKTRGIDFADDWGAALTAPIDEETLKLCGVAMLACVASGVIRGPIDGWIYGALVGLGFQVVENFTYALDSIVLNGATNPATSVGTSFVARVGITAWGSHWAMSAVAGTGIGILVARDGRRLAARLPGAVACWVLAMALHWFFDSPLLSGSGLFGTVCKVLVNLVVALLVYRAARLYYLARFRAVAAEEGPTGAILPPEAALLPRRHRRRQVAQRAPSPAARVVIEHIEGKQLALIETRIATAAGEAPVHAERLRTDIARLRGQLTAVNRPHRR